MTTAKCAYLLGMGSEPRRWERPSLFFAALFAANLVWLIIAPAINPMENSQLLLWLFYPPEGWLNLLLESLLLAAIATLAFRVIRNLFAIAPLILVYGLVRVALAYLFMPGRMSSWHSAFAWYLVSEILWALCLFVLLELALTYVKPLVVALLTGAVANTLLQIGINSLIGPLFVDRPLSFKARLLLLPFNLLSSVLLALTLYAGLRLTAGRAPLDEAPSSPRISKGFYLGTLAATEAVSVLVSIAVIVFILAGVWKLRQVSDITPVFLLLGVAGLLVLYAIVVFCMLIYKMWAAIQDGHARTTPGAAVGGLFIPFYNFYWMFQVFSGFAKDYNAFAERHALNVPRLSTGVFTAYAVICILAAIPYLGLLFVPAGYVLLLVMTARICNAVNRVPVAAPAPAPAVVEATIGLLNRK